MPDENDPRPAETFDTRSPDLFEKHHTARRLLSSYNSSNSTEQSGRQNILQELLGSLGKGVWIEPPFFCDYGDNIHLGDGVFVNFNCVILDGARVEIGSGTLLGPAVQIYATSHPLPSKDRIFEHSGVPRYRTTAAPVTIGQNVWIGGGAILLPGVTVGEGAVVGAGAVVTKPVPANVFAAGNPCEVLRVL